MHSSSAAGGGVAPAASSSSDTDIRFQVVVPHVKILDDPPGADPNSSSSANKESSNDSLFFTKTGRLDTARCAFQLRWYVSDILKGASPFVYHVNRDEDGQEICFNYHTSFQLESSNGVVAHLLQLSLVACTPQDAEAHERGEKFSPEQQAKNVRILGVLMIDLNAHVPRTALVSSQKATLYMARSPLIPAPLMRIAIHGKLVDAAAEDEEQRRQQQQASVPRRSADAHLSSSMTVSGTHNSHPDVSPAAVFVDGDDGASPIAASPPGGGGGAVTMMNSSNNFNYALIEELLERPTPADARALQEAFDTSKKQLRSLLTQNEQQRREIMTLNRRNRIQQEEMKKLRDQASEAGVQRIRAAYEAKISQLRHEMTEAKTTADDFRSLAQSAEILADSLTRELEQARLEAKAGVHIARGSQDQLMDALEKNARYEKAIKHGQEEIVKLHAYCAQAKGAFEDALSALTKERYENEMRKQRCEDLQKLLEASKLMKQKENTFNLPLR